MHSFNTAVATAAATAAGAGTGAAVESELESTTVADAGSIGNDVKDVKASSRNSSRKIVDGRTIIAPTYRLEVVMLPVRDGLTIIKFTRNQ